MEGSNEYNKEQHEGLIQDLIEMLFWQRNLSYNNLYADKNDLQNFSRCWKDGITVISMTGASMNIFLYAE